MFLNQLSQRYMIYLVGWVVCTRLDKLHQVLHPASNKNKLMWTVLTDWLTVIIEFIEDLNKLASSVDAIAISNLKLSITDPLTDPLPVHRILKVLVLTHLLIYHLKSKICQRIEKADRTWGRTKRISNKDIWALGTGQPQNWASVMMRWEGYQQQQGGKGDL